MSTTMTSMLLDGSQIESRNEEGNWVIRPQGNLIAGEATTLLDGLMEWFHSGSAIGFLDLTMVQSIDVTCMAVLVTFQRKLNSGKLGRHIVVENVQERLQPLFKLSQLRDLFQQHEEAIHA